MGINWIIIVVVMVFLILLIIYLIIRNQKDEKNIIESFNKSEIVEETNLNEKSED
jgi:preprotein translocase subunit SecG